MSSGSSTAPTVPVLGAVWAPYQKGYGEYRPRNVFNGGDPTGALSNITWQSWGGSTAVGHGTADYVVPGQTVAQSRPAPAQVRAYHLGVCKGKPAYLQLFWWFPQHGQTFDPTQVSRNICDGGAPYQTYTPGVCASAKTLEQSLFSAEADGHDVRQISCSGKWSAALYDKGGNAYPGTWNYLGGRWKFVERDKACSNPAFPKKLHWICEGS